MKRMLPIIAATVLLGQGCFTPFPSQTADEASPLPRGGIDTLGDFPPKSDTQSSKPSPSVNTPNLSFPGVLPESETKKTVRMQTSRGEIVIELLPDQGPNAASNFVYLINQKFYDGITFHRREEGFVIQGGDPDGNGTGGPGYQFADDAVKPVGQNAQVKPLPQELVPRMPPGSVLYARGTVAMANAGPNTNGSQFFIMLGDAPLPPAYSIFGRVTAGMEVVDAIKVGDRMTKVTVE